MKIRSSHLLDNLSNCLMNLNFSGSRDNCLNCPASARIISSFDFKHRTSYNISFNLSTRVRFLSFLATNINSFILSSEWPSIFAIKFNFRYLKGIVCKKIAGSHFRSLAQCNIEQPAFARQTDRNEYWCLPSAHKCALNVSVPLTNFNQSVTPQLNPVPI